MLDRELGSHDGGCLLDDMSMQAPKAKFGDVHNRIVASG